jgi:outer membrane protein
VLVPTPTLSKSIVFSSASTIALENNLQLRQQMLQVQTGQNSLELSQWQRYPTLNFSGSQGLQSGRNIDPFTNQFVEQTVNFSSFQLNTGVNLV